MSWLVLGTLFLTLCCMAYIAALIGIGGGVFYTPLQLFFGIGIHEAAATSLLLIIVLSVGASHIYHRAGKIDWGMAALLMIFMLFGGFAGGYLSQHIADTPLYLLLIAVTIFVGISMLWDPSLSRFHRSQHLAWYHWKRRSHGETYILNCLIAMPLSLAAGILSGLIGIGGGVIQVPMMAVLLGVPIDIAIATSGLMVGIAALGGISGHIIAGHVAWKRSLLMAPAVFLGAQLGAHTMLRIGSHKLKRIFGILMLLIATGLTVQLVLKLFPGLLP